MSCSLDPIFRPRAVAVIGASRRESSIGFALVHNLISAGFRGTIYPINPGAHSVHSIRAWPSIGAVDDQVDLAVVSVPRDLVEGVVDECLAEGVCGIVVVTAGFAETGAEGAAIEARIRDKVRAAGARMVGPNCMGVINTELDVCLNATFAPTPARHGSIGFVSQSGALGVAILNVASDLDIGLTQFASLGNRADVSGNDLMEHWADDPATSVIAMYLESFGNPRRFTETAKRVGRIKPILIVKSGRTEAGARAASSHTGALAAGADVTVSAFLDQCGVLRAGTIAELFDVARVLDRCPLPAGPRLGIVTNAGGPGIMATDAAINLGLTLPELQEETSRHLASFLPPEASVVNPVDMIASAGPANYARTVEAVLADPEVDMLMVINVTPLLSNPIDILEAVARAGRAYPEKPVIAVMMATDEFYEATKGRLDLPPVYQFPEPAALALYKLSSYAAWRRRPADEAIPEFATDDEAVAETLARVDEGYLPPEDVFRVLELYGIPLAPWRVVADLEGALRAAEEIGYPCVLKAIAPDLVHKSDVGAVAVGLEDPEQLREALTQITGRLGQGVAAGWLIQALGPQAHEVIFGVSVDPRFGPLLMFGLGGKYVEVFQNVRFAVTPVTPSEVREVVRGIQGFELLRGVRGDAAADLHVLYEVLSRLAQLVTRHPRIVELDINPFLAAADADQAMAVDARLRVARAADCPDPES